MAATNTPPASAGGALLAAALSYAPRTVPLIPRNKRPALEDWPAWRATRDAVTAYWSEHPDSNVGVRTGDGLAIGDIDPRAGGDNNLADLEHEHGELPPTVTVLSGGEDNGRHLWFKAPPELETFTLAAGVQIRARARTGAPQQCVAPPSIHPETGRAYRFADGLGLGEVPIAPLPRWMHGSRSDGAAVRRRTTDEWVARLRDDLTPGHRHETLMGVAAHVVARGVDPYVALVLVESFNRMACKPPLPTREVAEMVEWVARREGAA